MSIPIRLAADSAEPLYHQIKEQLRTLIVTEQLKENELLPSIRELAQTLSCSVITIRRVYQDLENEGLLRTKQGTGTFVAKVGKEEREQYRSDTLLEAFRVAVQIGFRMNSTPEEMRKLLEDLISVHIHDDPGEGK